MVLYMDLATFFANLLSIYPAWIYALSSYLLVTALFLRLFMYFLLTVLPPRIGFITALAWPITFPFVVTIVTFVSVLQLSFRKKKNE